MEAQPADRPQVSCSSETRGATDAQLFRLATVGQASPGRGHRVLAQLENRQRIALLITQNVDGLHQKAGSRAVLEPMAVAGAVPGRRQTWPRAAVRG